MLTFQDGFNHHYGRNSVAIDYVKARELYAKSEGNAGAICNLGILQALAHGGPKDEVAARKAFEIAANLGYPVCMRDFGIYLRDAKGGGVDVVQAREWFEKAAAAGDGGAALDLARMLRDGRGGAGDEPRARQLTLLAISRGNVAAHGDLAYLLDRGMGGPADPLAAARRLLLAQGLVGSDGDWSRAQLTGTMRSFSEATRKAVQEEFTQLGLYSGPIDGLWSATSQHAAELYLEKYVKAEKK